MSKPVPAIILGVLVLILIGVSNKHEPEDARPPITESSTVAGYEDINLVLDRVESILKKDPQTLSETENNHLLDNFHNLVVEPLLQSAMRRPGEGSSRVRSRIDALTTDAYVFMVKLYLKNIKIVAATISKEKQKAYLDQSTALPIIESAHFYNNLLSIFETAVNVLKDTPKKDCPGCLRDAKRLLTSYQKSYATNMSTLRKLYANKANDLFWEHNITVRSRGQNLTFTSHSFYNNKNIQQVYEGLRDAVVTLKYKRVYFEKYSGSESVYYTVN